MRVRLTLEFAEAFLLAEMLRIIAADRGLIARLTKRANERRHVEHLSAKAEAAAHRATR